MLIELPQRDAELIASLLREREHQAAELGVGWAALYRHPAERLEQALELDRQPADAVPETAAGM